MLAPLTLATLVAVTAMLGGCGDKNKAAKGGQALVSVNGEEITALQLNEELQRANVPPAQQALASKQLLEALVDRQLLQNEAAKEKVDRDPKVVQAIDRARALIIAQAYMQKKLGTIAQPTTAEVSDYYSKNPEFFANRKQFDMRQLVIATSDLTDELKKVADSSKSLDDVATWLDAHQIKYARAQASRTSSDLAPEMSAKLKSLPKGQLFVVKEGDRSMLVSLVDIKDSPAPLEIAASQIEKFLLNKRSKDAADAELARLRAIAKIEYLNKAVAPASPPEPATAAAPAASAGATSVAPTGADADAAARGVAGLK